MDQADFTLTDRQGVVPWRGSQYSASFMKPALPSWLQPLEPLDGASPAGVYLELLTDYSGTVSLSRTRVLPATTYTGPSPRHPLASVWLTQALLGAYDDATRTPVAALDFVHDRKSGLNEPYFSLLKAVSTCMLRQKPAQVVLLARLVRADGDTKALVQQLKDVPEEERVQAASAAAAAAAGGAAEYAAFGPAYQPLVANCSVLSVPSPLGLPRTSNVQYSTVQYLSAVQQGPVGASGGGSPLPPEQDIYAMLASDDMPMTILDVMGVHAEASVLPGRALTLSRLVLVNLPPGGYQYGWARGSMAALPGWLDEDALHAAFAGQSLPVWYVDADRCVRAVCQGG